MAAPSTPTPASERVPDGVADSAGPPRADAPRLLVRLDGAVAPPSPRPPEIEAGPCAVLELLSATPQRVPRREEEAAPLLVQAEVMNISPPEPEAVLVGHAEVAASVTAEELGQAVNAGVHVMGLVAGSRETSAVTPIPAAGRGEPRLLQEASPLGAARPPVPSDEDTPPFLPSHENGVETPAVEDEVRDAVAAGEAAWLSRVRRDATITADGVPTHVRR